MQVVVAGIEPSRTRTCDPLVKSQLLYQLSYRPTYMRRARSGVLFSIAREVAAHSTEPLLTIQTCYCPSQWKHGYDRC
jgi:hypothetical protein